MAPWFGKRQKQQGIRVLTAAGKRIDVGDRHEAMVMRALRQGWQADAWNYWASIGEIHYAVKFLANCAARMQLYTAAYPNEGETDKPAPLAEVAGIPPEVASIAEQAMLELGHGKLALGQIMAALSTNTSVAGESWLVGIPDPVTGEPQWKVRSVHEIVIKDDRWTLREVPADAQGIIPWITLDPRTTVLSRIWTPSPQFSKLADSPMRAMLDDCESLLILRRMIRAEGRSRLATAGILVVPNELSIKAPTDDNADPQADPFMGPLAEAMMEPIADEGVASAVVPIVVRGPVEAAKELRHIDMARSFDAEAGKLREELIGIIATSFDLPKEVITGIVDLNHWSAWQVDDNTFRHHVEPHVIECCDSLTAAYLRPYLEAAGVDATLARRVCIWYDATELVTHPDQTKDALDLHDRLVISDEALLRVAGFEAADKPGKPELQVRLLEKMRTWPPNLVMAFLHAWDPTLVAPSMTGPPAIPGIGPGGVEAPEPPPGTPPAAGAAPSPPAQPGGGLPSPATAPPGHNGTPPMQRQLPAPPTTASGGLEAVATVLAADPERAEQLLELLAHAPIAHKADAAAPGEGSTAPEGASEEVPTEPVTLTPEETEQAEAALREYETKTDAEREKEREEAEKAGEPEPGDAPPTAPPGGTIQDLHPRIQREWAQRATRGAKQRHHAKPKAHKGEKRGKGGRFEPLTAAGKRRGKGLRTSQRLVAIDQDLRARLQVAANAAMLRQLERAGQRLRKSVARDERARGKIAHKSTYLVAAALGPAGVAATGLTPTDLLGRDWNGLKAQFEEWVAAAQQQAVRLALGLVDPPKEVVKAAEARLEEQRALAWRSLAAELSQLAERLLYHPHPDDEGPANPNTLVPTGVLRRALAIAGGAKPRVLTAAGEGEVNEGAVATMPTEGVDVVLAGDEPSEGGSVSVGVGQIGTGEAVGDLIEAGGGGQEGWEWVHGPALNPFEPHVDLDGTTFVSFDDEALANTGDFPDNEFYMPGDHDGCTCDYMPVLLAPDEVPAAEGGPSWEDAVAMVAQANEGTSYGTANAEVHAASTTTDHPQFFYHQSKASNRESIDATGLEANRSLGGKTTRIYLAEERPVLVARSDSAPKDLYRIDTAGLPLRPDPELPGKWAIAEQDIAAARLNLIGTTHPDGLPG
jgi:hypothetical protein